MFGRIVKRDGLIEDAPGLPRCLAVVSKEMTHDAMPDHERSTVALCFSRERQELRRKLAHNIAIERDVIRDPEAVEDRKQQQRIFGRLAERFSLFDQQARLLQRPPWFPAQAYPLRA